MPLSGGCGIAKFGLEFLSIRPPQLHRIQQYMIRKRDMLS